MLPGEISLYNISLYQLVCISGGFCDQTKTKNQLVQYQLVSACVYILGGLLVSSSYGMLVFLFSFWRRNLKQFNISHNLELIEINVKLFNNSKNLIILNYLT